MEAFTLLKYWRTSGGTGGGTATLFTGDSTSNSRATTKTVVNPAAATPYSDYGFDGPYFDLEFTLTDDNNDETSETTETESESGAEDSSGNENNEEEKDADELKIALTSDESELKFPVSLLKSATKFRVLLPKLKKSSTSSNGILEKAEKSEANGRVLTSPKTDEREILSTARENLHTVKFNVEEVKGPLVSLLARDNSSTANNGGGVKHSMQDSDANSASEERNLAKEMMHKYLNMLKPLYVRVSSRYVEKMKFSGQVSFTGEGPKCGGAVSPPCAASERGREVLKAAVWGNVKAHQKQGNNNYNLQAGLRVMRKHLGKSRSTSAAAAVSQPVKMGSKRRDDSLLELQDGIQGAILHCKRSFNANRDGESAILSRSVSDPSYEKSAIMPTDSGKTMENV